MYTLVRHQAHLRRHFGLLLRPSSGTGVQHTMLHTSDHILPVSDHVLPVSDHVILPVSDHVILPVSDHILPVSD